MHIPTNQLSNAAKLPSLGMIALALAAMTEPCKATLHDPALTDSLGTLVVTTGTVEIYTGSRNNLAVVPTITADSQIFNGVPEDQTADIDGKTYSARVAVFCFDSIQIDSGVTITVTGSRALVLLSKADFLLKTALSVSAVTWTKTGPGYSNYAPGASDGFSNFNYQPGGAYAADTLPTSGRYPGAKAYGEDTLTALLLGGSNGGNHYSGDDKYGGRGGGAVELGALGTLCLDELVSANGGEGQTWIYQGFPYGGAGGGSGGGILVSAPNVVFGPDGRLHALGGAGQLNLNNGSGGRIAVHATTTTGIDEGDINTLDGTINLVLDADGDGLTNAEEIAAGTNPNNSDSDGDGFSDGWETDKGWSPLADDSDVIDHILANKETFGLYTPDDVGLLVPGDVTIVKTGGSISLSLQLEKSDDMVTWSDVGDPVIWTFEVEDLKSLYRVRSSQ